MWLSRTLLHLIMSELEDAGGKSGAHWSLPSPASLTFRSSPWAPSASPPSRCRARRPPAIPLPHGAPQSPPLLRVVCLVKEFPDEPGLRAKVDDLHKTFRKTYRGVNMVGDRYQSTEAKLQSYTALMDRLVELSGQQGLKWQAQLTIAYVCV